ncbi:mediator of RNA polymerase II transcription subunit 8 [Monosporozyma servazzii]
MNQKPLNSGLQNSVQIDYHGIPSQALDAVRMRLAQLIHSLKRIRDELAKPELPQWYSLQSQLNITLQQLLSVTSTLEHFQETLDTSIIYPLPQFPTTSHENLLTTLLRKKYTPEVDDWLKASREAAEIDVHSLTENKIKEILQTDKDITKWALEIFSKEYETYNSKTAKQDAEDDSKMIVDEEDRYSHYKPTKPFEVETVLTYMNSGRS